MFHSLTNFLVRYVYCLWFFTIKLNKSFCLDHSVCILRLLIHIASVYQKEFHCYV